MTTPLDKPVRRQILAATMGLRYGTTSTTYIVEISKLGITFRESTPPPQHPGWGATAVQMAAYRHQLATWIATSPINNDTQGAMYLLIPNPSPLWRCRNVEPIGARDNQ